MASIVDNVVAKMIEHLETVTVGTHTLRAKYGPIETTTRKPFAWVRVDRGDIDYSVISVDRKMDVVIALEGSHADVSSLLESISVLWESNAKWAELCALGAVNIDVLEIEEPFHFPNASAFGAITLRVHTRKAITGA